MSLTGDGMRDCRTAGLKLLEHSWPVCHVSAVSQTARVCESEPSKQDSSPDPRGGEGTVPNATRCGGRRSAKLDMRSAGCRSYAYCCSRRGGSEVASPTHDRLDNLRTRGAQSDLFDNPLLGGVSNSEWMFD